MKSTRRSGGLPALVGPLLAGGLNVVGDHFGRPDPGLAVDDPGFRYLLAQAPTRRRCVKLSGADRSGPDGIGDTIADAAAPLLLPAAVAHWQRRCCPPSPQQWRPRQ